MGKIFNKNTPAVICLFMAVFCFSGSSRADMREPELFEKAYGYYLASNPEKALETFDLFLQQFPESSALDSIYFWRAKALMQMKRNEEAAKGFRKLREVFPESSYSLFAEKELETLNQQQKTVKADVVREKTAKNPDTRIPDHTDRIRKLEAEKADLEKQLTEIQKKTLLTEKGLSKALDDKNTLESQLDTLKRDRDELAKRTAALEAGNKESTAWHDEKKALESRIKISEEKVAALSNELVASKDNNAALTREHVGKVQQSEKNQEKLELQLKELKAEKMTLADSLKEKDRIIADSRQTILALKNSSVDAQSSKQRDLENMNQQISQLASEKALLQNEVAIEKKKSDELLLKLREKDETIQRVLSEESQRKTAAAAALDSLKQKDEELARVQTEKDGLQSRIKALEVHDRERADLAQQAEDAKKLREEAARTTGELVRLQKENTRLLEENKALGLRLSETEERTQALAAAKDRESEKERNALLAKSQDIEKKLGESEERVRLLSGERQKLDAEAKEKDQKLAKALDSVALLEKRRGDLEKEKESSGRTLNDKAVKFAQEKAFAEAELNKEMKKAADLAARNAENETALLKERKALEQARRELEARDREKGELAGQAAEAGKCREELAAKASRIDSTATDNKKLLDEKQALEKSVRDAEVKYKAMFAKAEGDWSRERTAFSGKLLDAEKKLKDSDLALKKNNEERQVAEARIQQDQAKLKKLDESITLLEKSMKGSELEKEKKIQELTERIRIAETDKKSIVEELALERRKTAELSGKGTEKEAALMNTIKTLESSRQDLEARLAAEKTGREIDIKKLEAERAELRNRLKDLEAQAVTAKAASAVIEENRKKQDELIRTSAAEKEILRLKSVQAELESKLAAAEEKTRNLSSAKQNEVLALQDKQRVERQLQEKEGQTAKDRETIALLEKRLKDSEQERTAALQILNEKLSVMLQEKKQLEAALSGKQALDQQDFSKIQGELAEMKRVNDAYTKKNSTMEKELEALKAQMQEYEKPYVRIGQEQFSLSSILRDGTASRQLTDRIQVKNVPWRAGNILDDSLTEQVMARKAAEEGIIADEAVMRSLTKQFALSPAEGTYLARYLAADALYRKKTTLPAITEKDARDYYEKHKDNYANGRDVRIKLLSVSYGKSDELDKGLLAVEIQQEAQSGKTFEAIAGNHAADAAMREMSLSLLPEWVRLKLASIKKGEVSDIIAAEDQFMIIQSIGDGPAYRPFDEVRQEINTALSAEQTRQKQAVQDWLISLRKDIEFLR